ncbi:MAG: lysophospholipid acyltransferase family protein [Acidobacteriota bacterium]
MITLPRAGLRTVLLVLVTFLSYLGVLLLLPLRSAAPSFHLRWRNRVFRFWARGMCRGFGARVRVEGKPPVGPFFLVSNHVSYVDIPLLASGIHGSFVAKADLAGWPLIGRAFRVADTIFIDRGRKRDLLRVITEVDASLARNLGVVLFPEGTSGKGDCILPLKPSILDLAARRGMPVHYANITYTTPDGEPPPSRSVCWWGDEAFFPHFKRLIVLPWFEAVVRFADEPIAAADRKELAAKLHGALDQAHEPMP